MCDLAGRVAIVTGASGNLGPAWISALAGAGAIVIAIDIQSGQPPEGAAALERADVTDRAAVQAVLDNVLERYGVPHVLVNNAGLDLPPTPGARGAAIKDIAIEDFRRVVDVNLVGTFNVTAVVGSAMADAGRGSIVSIGSLYASIAPIPALYDHMDPPFLKPPAYGASKAGLVQLTKYFARLWGPRDVRVNALSPGGIRGAQDPRFAEKFSARVALGRLGEVSELAGPLLFLASDASCYVSGQDLRVDGGFTA